MAMAVMSWIIAMPLLGICTGFRTMTPIALVCWYAHLGYLPVHGTWAFWAASPIAVGLFTLLAIGEYIGDKLPRTPSRISPLPLIARISFGGLVGGIVATALMGSIIEGILLGVIGALIGAFGGYYTRHSLVQNSGWPDLRVALIEDGLTLFGSFFALGIVTG
ncbi:MAG: glycine zipper 2TM domain-containing protein [Acidobacteriaceae bacterium]